MSANPVKPQELMDLRSVMDEGVLGHYRIKVLFLIVATLLCDGYDIAVISYAAPALTTAWQLEPGAMGNAFSAGLAGMILGGACFGMIADVIGRRKTLIVATIISGFATLGTAWAADVDALVIWRFVTGIGIGSIAPVAIVLANEYAPRRVRALVVTLMFFGLGAAGTGTAGLVSTFLVPRYGWEVLFLFGGVLQLAIAALLLSALPESLKFLFVKRPESPELRRIAGKIRSDLSVGPTTKFIWTGESESKGSVPLRLVFAQGRAILTPVLWASMFCAQVVTFALLLWLPTLLQTSGHSPGTVATAMLFHNLLGLAGAVVIARYVDKYGVVALTALPVLGIAIALFIGTADSTGAPMLAAVAAAGFAVQGTLQGLFVVSSFFYPTAVRSTGVGAAIFISRFGSMLGPWLVGLLLSRGASVQTVLHACTIPLLIAAVAIAVLGRLDLRRLRIEQTNALQQEA